jgi:hypothetical protein
MTNLHKNDLKFEYSWSTHRRLGIASISTSPGSKLRVEREPLILLQPRTLESRP